MSDTRKRGTLRRRPSQLKQALERSDPRAPFLFDENDLPLRPGALESIKRERYKCTGAHLLADDQLALKMVERLLCGWGLKRIAAELQVSKHTLLAAREVLVVQGKLAPYKQRVVSLWEQIIELGAHTYLGALEGGSIAPAQIPLASGIFADKRAAALGEPTAVVAGLGAASAGQVLSEERLNAFVDGLKPAEIDSPTSLSTTKAQ